MSAIRWEAPRRSCPGCGAGIHQAAVRESDYENTWVHPVNPSCTVEFIEAWPGSSVRLFVEQIDPGGQQWSERNWETTTLRSLVHDPRFRMSRPPWWRRLLSRLAA